MPRRFRSWLARRFGRDAPTASTARESHVATAREPRAATAPGPHAAPTRLVVGLGNPGPQYAATRHNAGFLVLERLAARHAADWRDAPDLEGRLALLQVAGEPCVLLAPQTFMNRSGRSVEAALARWPALDPERDLLVVYDDLDLPTGRLRLRPSGGAGGHRGMGDIQTVLATKAVPRLRFGVGRPASDGPSVVDYVLAPFSEEEAEPLAAAIERAVDAIERVVAEGLPAVMGEFNARS